MFPAQWLFGQSIKGKVQEGKQRIPLPGVAIQEKGTPNGVIADENGQFNIDPQKFPCVLVFSFIGYDTQEINFPKPPYTSFSPSGDEVVMFLIGLIFNQGFLAIVPFASGPYQGDHK